MKTQLFYSALFAVALSFTGCADKSAETTVNPLLANEDKITEIISGMTLEEKINMLHGKNMFSSAGIERLGIGDIEYADGPFGIREEMEPHSWNSLGLSTDSATFFPTGSALAATWSPEMAYLYGKGMAIEARLRGKDMILGPAMNIQRIPTGGRTYEYMSEDPMLTGELATQYTLGAQDNEAAVCLKHYALNNQENMRGFVNVNVSDRVMREIYLKPFEEAVRRANAYGVMAAYNKVGGYWCSENDLLQNKILRDEWGFRGIIISDWGGTHSTVGAAMGGLDVEMPGNQYMGQALLDSVNAGVVPMEVIDAKVRNLLRVRFAIPAVPDSLKNVVMTSQPEQQKIAYEVASRSVVLLKNEGLLPISKDIKKIAVIGDNATCKMANGGVGAGVKALYEVTPLEGIQKAFAGTDVDICFAQGYNPVVARRWGPQPDFKAEAKKSEAMAKEALEIAKNADLVLFVGGDNRWVETEGSDRVDMNLKFDQEGLLKSIAAVNPNIVTVIVAGAPVDLQVVNQVSKSLVYSWFNGSEGGNALADILTGKLSPSGKLPFTLPIKLEDSPAYALGNYPQKVEDSAGDVFVDLVNKDKFRAQQKADAEYSEGLFVGYRWFTSKDLPTMYPFGFGLSYADFKYSDVAATVAKNEIKVTFTLENSSDVAAEEVAQVYVSRPATSIERPKYELKGFQRVALAGGEKKAMSISIPVESLRHWDETNNGWALEKGAVTIYVGNSSVDLPLTADVEI